MIIEPTNQAEAGPSSSPNLIAGPTPYHESSQYLHWRYSPSQLQSIRSELNHKSVEIVGRNSLLEKEAQISLGHAFTDPPPQTTYLTVDDEHLLLRFYCAQVSKICRHGFGLPEVVEATAISYLKRFYLKNSVMEWHPKTIMPTCLFLAAKTTNYPVPINDFTPKFAKLSQTDVLDTEFTVAQSLGFAFWIRGAEKAVRGWTLEFQSFVGGSVDRIQKAIAPALDYLQHSRLSDVEFLYTPSQIGLATLHLADSVLVDEFLARRYESDPLVYGIEKDALVEIVSEIEDMIRAVGKGEVDLKKVKEVDKRLKGCTNPEKIPGTALYIRRKREQETSVAAAKAIKTLKAKEMQSDREMVFGDVIKSERKPLSPRVTVAMDTNATRGDGVALGESGMGVKDESMGLVVGGKGLREVGKELIDEEEEDTRVSEQLD